MTMRSLLGLGAIAAAIASAVAGCGLNPVKMPPPAFGDKFGVVIEFSNALNLPLGAKVTFEGGTVGAVSDVGLDKVVVAVTANINAGTTIPSDATAAIVQDTILGDSYVKLTRSDADAVTDTARPLGDGARIPVDRTQPPASVEDMMTTMSWFLGTGSLQRIGATLRGINAVLPKTDADTRRVATTLAADLRSIAKNSDDLDRTLDTLQRSAGILADQADNFEDLASDSGLDFWNKMFTTLTGVVVAVTSLNSILANSSWLIPAVDSASNMWEQVGVPGGGGPAQIGFADQAPVNRTLLPFLTNPPVVLTQPGPGR